MKPFCKTIVVKENDLDDLNHVNNVRFVQWIQDISKEHWKTKASIQMQSEIIWVVLNHNISYKAAAFIKDKIRIETHIADSNGAISTRVVKMFNSETNQLIITSKTQWCLLHAKTLKPTRISKEIKDMFIEQEDKTPKSI